MSNVYTKEVTLIQDTESDYAYKIKLEDLDIRIISLKYSNENARPMTEAEANAIADAVLERYNNPRTEAEEFELVMLNARFKTADPSLVLTDFQRKKVLEKKGNLYLTSEEEAEAVTSIVPA